MPVASLAGVVEAILEALRTVPASRSLLVAISGIDGSGKGHASARIGALLAARRVRSASINVDGWLNLPHRRFAAANPAEHFYEHAIRFDAMFDTLVLPLRNARTVRVDTDHAEETAVAYRTRHYEFHDIDVILLEGIYLLKRQLLRHYDLSFWIECGFETALERAVQRAQEGLPPEETVAAYRHIYFPAQLIHFVRDDPRTSATAIVYNDPRLAS